jgi:asparagine synthase (glutamine-hydrolysing)
MRETLEHRGPDAAGEAEISGPDGLRGWFGHQRLRVVDLSEASRQPMTGDDGNAVLTYNGEIYNFQELRQELRQGGVKFTSGGDTEVVLRAYEAWGESFVERLDGMFALALWDSRRGRLILARDRTGKKPLFYARSGGRVTFASEIKALLACPWTDAVVDESAIPEYLTYGYVPHPATMYRDIQQVPPASVVVVDRGRVHDARRYWSALPTAGQDLRPSRPVLDEIARLLDAATQRRMVADVPLGALLSGGIDSSLVVGLMSRHAAERIHTFAIGFPEDPAIDERSHARRVAEHFDTKHTEFAVKMDAVSLVDRLLWHHDQPFADSSAIPTFVVAQLARREVTVVLNGDGGDEIFGGYERFRALALSRMVPTGAGRLAKPIVDRFVGDGGYGSLGRRARRFLERAGEAPVDRYQSWISVAPEDMLPGLLSPELRSLATRERLRRSMQSRYDEASALSPLDQVLYANLLTYLPDDLSVKVDRMSMAHGLEARSPFLDTALIDYVARLPARHKVGLRHVKPILRRALWPLLPEATWNRKKQGFGVPMHQWFRGELGTMFVDEVLAADARSAAYLDQPALRGMMRDHQSGAAQHGARLWTVLMLERWLRSTERPQTLRPPTTDSLIEAETVA